MKAETATLALFSKIKYTSLEAVSTRIQQMTFLNLARHRQHGFKLIAKSLCHLKGNLLSLLPLMTNTFSSMAVSIFYRIKSLMMPISINIRNGSRSILSTTLRKESKWALPSAEEGSLCLVGKVLNKMKLPSLTTCMKLS